MEKSGVFYPGRMDCENSEKYPPERQSEKSLCAKKNITFHFSNAEINWEGPGVARTEQNQTVRKEREWNDKVGM